MPRLASGARPSVPSWLRRSICAPTNPNSALSERSAGPPLSHPNLTGCYVMKSNQLVTYAVIDSTDGESNVHPLSGESCISVCQVAFSLRCSGRQVSVEKVVVENFGTEHQSVKRFRCPVIQRWLKSVKPYTETSQVQKSISSRLLRRLINDPTRWKERPPRRSSSIPC